MLNKSISFSVIIGMLLLAAGCSGGDHTYPSSATGPQEESVDTLLPVSKKPIEETEEPSQEKQPEDEKNNISLASPEPETITPPDPEELLNPEPETPAKTQPSEPEVPAGYYDVSAPFDPAAPTLMGLKIGMDKTLVLERFGKPLGNNSLPGEDNSASVLQYPGFIVGTQDNKVLFVEVYSSAVNPGLNDFRLGGSRDEAIRRLGKPTRDTEFVISYIANGSVLKLDTDPESRRIHSIKLFGEE